ncbi:comEA protein [Catenulispora sp. EB89]|uniref:ComEA family DNA-binding protein n=1 Tax=Catenulispora sp. EB89 TaxID=3156257 RepID=UPI003516F3C4
MALVAVAGAAAGGWYLTRSQGTVVDVAGEAASTSQPPDDSHITPTADTAAPPGDPRGGKPGGTAAGHDGACREHAWNSGPPRAVPDAPTGWNARVLRVVPAEFDGSTLESGPPAERGSGPAARAGARMALAGWYPAEQTPSSEAVGAPAGWWSVGQAGADMAPVRAASTLSGWYPADGANAPSSEAAGAVAGWRSAGHAGAGLAPVRAASMMSGWYPSEQARAGAHSPFAGLASSLSGWSFAKQASVLVPPSELAEVSLSRPANVLWPVGAPGWPQVERAGILAVTPMGRWYPAPIVRRYVVAMAVRAAKACSPHAAMATSPALAGAASASAVVVDVEGKVAHPGVQMLPVGARVYEALAAAGGALPGVDVTALDLARPVADGEQLRVGIAGAPGPVVGLPQASVGGGSRGKRGKPAEPVNLNTATLEQLEAVPDVGPALAQRILDWRAEHGRFASVSQLRQVRGIGERKFADMRDSVTV